MQKNAMQSEFRRYANLSGCDMMLRSKIHAVLFNLIFHILHQKLFTSYERSQIQIYKHILLKTFLYALLLYVLTQYIFTHKIITKEK